MSKITMLQQRKLQTVYSQWARRFLFEADTRDVRLREMGERAGRRQPLNSANDLNSREAKLLIDSFQAELGIAETQPPRRVGTTYSKKLGTEGRHDQIHSETTLVSARDLERIGQQLTRLGWDQTRLEAFLASPSGPNGRRVSIHTLADANRVYWALKHMKPTPNFNKEKQAS